MQRNHPAIEAPRVTLAAAKDYFDADQATFVDVRAPDDFARAHIPGAVSLPLREIPRRYPELPRDRRLLFY